MQLLYLVGFNNYFNRKIIYYTDVGDYTGNSSSNFPQSSIDFNPNDGVSTEQIVNWAGGNETPDYVLVLNESDESIVSRWFVTEWVRTRGGQYKATLKRDVIADHYNNLDIVRLFAERGPIIDQNSSLIYNNEGLSLNQIKTSQTALKDETEESWIVGYLNRSLDEDKSFNSISEDTYDDIPELTSLGIKLNNVTDPLAGATISSVKEDANGNPILGAGVEAAYEIKTGFIISAHDYFRQISYMSPTIDTYGVFNFLRTVNPLETWTRRYLILVASLLGNNAEWFRQNWIDVANSYPGLYAAMRTAFFGAHPEYTTYSNYIKVLGTKDLVVRYNNKYYKINVIRTTNTDDKSFTTTSTVMPGAYFAIREISNNAVQNMYDKFGGNSFNSNIIGNPVSICVNEYYTTLSLEEVPGPGVLKTNININRRHCSDQPYDIFCMRNNKDNLALAQVIGQELSTGQSGFIYDIQILPYCPARYALVDIMWFLANGHLPATTRLIEHKDYEKILNDEDEVVDYMFWCNKSSDTFILSEYVDIPIKTRTNDSVLDKKLSNECDLYRLSSPNMSSSFEFSVAKNNGVDYFNVSFTYKPYQPYIRITPNFKGLYGSDYKDSRGLVLQGDFSIDVITDQWKQYQIQNKNYENIFNTQIKKMDDDHSLAMKYGAIGATTKAVSGIAAAASMGALGGQIAQRVSVARSIDTAGGLAGSMIGLAQKAEQYSLNRQYEVDMYNYQLGNVKALPDTLTKVTAYNIDNNYFPVIEYYTCSEEEVEIVKKKIQFENYKLMETTTLGELMSRFNKGQGLNFVKGIVIYNPVEDDEHMLSEMYNEINKGVYL